MLKNKNRTEQVDEEVSVGGGATGVSKVPGPVVKGNVHANRPQDKSQGDMSQIELNKVATPGQDEEETNTETNTRPTGNMSARHRASVAMKDSAASAKMEEYDLDEESDHVTTSVQTMSVGRSMSDASKHGLTAKRVSGDEVSVTGPRVHVKKFLNRHYGGASQVETDVHPEVYGKTSAKMEEVETELAQLFGEEASAEFVTEASALFNAAINDRVSTIKEELENEYSTRLDEEVEAATDAMMESVDKYLSYAVQQWIEENKLAIENNLRAEIAEEFIDGLKNLFAEHYIDVPEEKTDVVEDLAARVEQLEQMVNEKTDEVIELQKAISEARAHEIVDQMTEGLAVTQAEKLKTLCEGLTYDNDESFARKVQVIKENYFSSEKKPAAMLTESFDEGSYEEVEMPTGPMAKYVKAIARTTVK